MTTRDPFELSDALTTLSKVITHICGGYTDPAMCGWPGHRS